MSADYILIERWFAQRDGEAFKAIVDAYGAMIYASARRLVGDGAEAEDLTQECFAALAGAKSPPRAPLGPWLHRVVTNRALTRIRSERRRSARDTRWAKTEPASEDLAWKEIEQILDECVAELPERLRAPVVEHYLLGKSHSDIARDLGVSRQTVTYRIEKGLNRLRSLLVKRGVSVGALALAAMLETDLSAALPLNVALSLGKTALASACRATVSSTTAVPLAVKGVIVMTLAKKIAVGLGVVAIVAAGYMASAKLAPQPREVEQRAIPQEPVKVEVAQRVEGPAAIAVPAVAPEQEEVTVAEEPARAEEVQAPPIDGIWIIESYLYTSEPDEELKEMFSPEDRPEARIELKQNPPFPSSIKMTVLEKWARQLPYGSLEGFLNGHSATWGGGGGALPFVGSGTFNSDWTECVCDGGYNIEEATKFIEERGADLPPDVLEKQRLWVEAMRIHIVLKRADEVESKTLVSDLETLKQRRQQAGELAHALYDYARNHEGRLPASLEELVPHYLKDASLIGEMGNRVLRYIGGSLPAGFLQPTTPFPEMLPDAPLGERLTAWEAELQEHWGGSTSPILPTALVIEHQEPYLQFNIDPQGNIIERNAVVAEGSPEAVQQSQEKMKLLGTVLAMFRNENDSYLPGGWCCVYPEYLSDLGVLVNSVDSPPNHESYVILAPATSLDDIAQAYIGAESGQEGAPTKQEAYSQIPIAAEAREYGGQNPGRVVLFADGHVQLLTSQEYAEACRRLGMGN